MQDGPKVVWSILYVSVAFFPSLKQNFIAYRSSKVSDCILKFTNCNNHGLVGCIPIAAVAVSFEAEIIKIGQSSHKMYRTVFDIESVLTLNWIVIYNCLNKLNSLN